MTPYRKLVTLLFCLLSCISLATAQDDERKDREPSHKSQRADAASPSLTKQNAEVADPTQAAPASSKAATPDFNRWYYGGNVWFAAQNNVFQLDLSPQVGYRLTPKFMLGAGVVLQPAFGRFNLLSPVTGQLKATDVTFGTYGGNVFSRYELLPWLFAHGEMQYLERSFPTGYLNDKNQPDLVHGSIPAGMLGLGSYLNVGPVRINVMALYNFLYDPYNQFDLNRSPIVLRGGVGFGF